MFLNGSNAEAIQAVYHIALTLITARLPLASVHVSPFTGKVVSLHGRVAHCRCQILGPLLQARLNSPVPMERWKIGDVSRVNGHLVAWLVLKITLSVTTGPVRPPIQLWPTGPTAEYPGSGLPFRSRSGPSSACLSGFWWCTSRSRARV